MSSKNLRPVVFCVAGGVALFLFSGCDAFKGMFKKEETKEVEGVVLAKIDGKAAISKDEFYKELASQMRNMDPALLPLNMQRKILDDLIRVKLMVEAAKKSGIESESEFKAAFKEQADRLSELLLSRFYSKKIFDKIEVSDKEVVEDFIKNKNKYIKEPGGVAVKGISFKDKDSALAFYDKVRNNVKDFESMAKEDKDGKFKDFGRVIKEEGQAPATPAQISEAAMKMTKLPAADVVTVEKTTWVIVVSDKKEPTLFELAEIKEQLKNQLKYNKFKDIYEKHLNELKNDFTIDVNEDFFKEAEKKEATEVPFDDSSRSM